MARWPKRTRCSPPTRRWWMPRYAESAKSDFHPPLHREPMGATRAVRGRAFDAGRSLTIGSHDETSAIGEPIMAAPDGTKYLRIALLLVGLIFIFGIYPLTILWPSGWSWHTSGRSDYLEMILGIYVTLGVFLIVASRNPLAH